MNALTTDEVRRFADMWKDIGLPPKSIAPVIKALTRRDALEAEYEMTVSKTDSVEAIINDLALGRLTVAESAQALAVRAAIRAETIHGLVQEAQDLCRRDAVGFLRANPGSLADQADKVTSAVREWMEDVGLLTPAAPVPLTEEEEREARMALGSPAGTMSVEGW